MVFAALILVLLMTVPVSLMYVACEQAGRERWRQIPEGQVAAGPTGVFREPTMMPRFHRQAPRAIRTMAFACLFMGQMFVPGLIMAAIGLFAYGLGLVGIPGLIVAARLFGSGMDLLDHRSGTAARAAKAARLAKQLNYTLAVVLAACGVWFTVAGHWNDTEIFWALNGLYIAVSLVHATLLSRVVTRYRAELDQRHDEPVAVAA